MAGASISSSRTSSFLSQRRRRSLLSSGDGGKSVDTGDKRLSTTLLDPKILDCPICFEALMIPIFQCKNGHLACSFCCPKLSNKCPFCASPIDNNRCRAMESVLESFFIPCQNSAFGCTQNVSYVKESPHEKECIFSQCTCPALDCDYSATYINLDCHFLKHTDKYRLNWFNYGVSFRVWLNISDKLLISTVYGYELLFPVQCFEETCGVYVTVSCIAPPSPKIGEFSYRISYTMGGDTVIYESAEVKRVLQVSFETPQENFMLIPRSLVRGELLELEVCINKLKQV